MSGQRSRQAPRTLYVDQRSPSCSDTGSGTLAQPFCKIAPAASRVKAGRTVLVFSGTYHETVTVPKSGTARARIAFAAAPGNDVSVTGGRSSRSFGFYV